MAINEEELITYATEITEYIQELIEHKPEIEVYLPAILDQIRFAVLLDLLAGQKNTEDKDLDSILKGIDKI